MVSLEYKYFISKEMLLGRNKTEWEEGKGTMGERACPPSREGLSSHKFWEKSNCYGLQFYL